MTTPTITPYLGNDGAIGRCAHWDHEPSPEEAAPYISNEWSCGSTCAPQKYIFDVGTGGKNTTMWGVALFVTVLFVSVGTILIACAILGPVLAAVWAR